MQVPANLKDKANQIASKLSLEVKDMLFVDEDGQHLLRVILDKQGGISLDEITDFTREFNNVLDSDNSLSFSYSLDCCSPGSDASLDLNNLGECVGEKLLFTTSEGEEIVAKLTQVGEEGVDILINLKGRMKKRHLDWSELTSVKLYD